METESTNSQEGRPGIDNHSSLCRTVVRSEIFRQISGLALVPLANALMRGRVFATLESYPAGTSISQLAETTRANFAYLAIAMRVLEGCGWVQATTAGRYALTQTGQCVGSMAPWFSEATQGLSLLRQLSTVLAEQADSQPKDYVLEALRFARERKRLVHTTIDTSRLSTRVESYLDGPIVAPVMVALDRSGILEQLACTPPGLALSRLTGDTETIHACLTVLGDMHWVEMHRGMARFTESGRHAARLAGAYGVTLSYAPLLLRLPRLLFPDSSGAMAFADEAYVDREMNLWGSTRAHRTYFEACSRIVCDQFADASAESPIGICDMGCGDGTLLVELHSHLMRMGSQRWRKRPPVIVGVDVSPTARRLASERLAQAGLGGAMIIDGEISRPDDLARQLCSMGVEAGELLHVRSFVDHNREFGGNGAAELSYDDHLQTSGTFAVRGKHVSGPMVVEDLVRNLERWRPITRRFGLVAIELHTLSPEILLQNLDATPCIAYDIIHGYSDQYLVEYNVFLACAARAGFVAKPTEAVTYPNTRVPVVSVTRFC